MGFKKWTASGEQLAPDPKYSSILVSKLINYVMVDGKKSKAARIVYGAMDIVAGKIKDVPALEVLEQAIDNVKPEVEVRSRRVGGANYQVPMTVSSKRRQSLAFRWIIQAVRARKGKPTDESLAEELLAAYRKEGAAMTTRDNVHRMAEANKAFVHFAW